jgi:spermidine synthase
VVRAFLQDPRLNIRVEDGRHALRQTDRRYDLIEMDPLKPEWGMSGHIYSREFFEMVRERLAPGGLFCAWTPTPRVERTIEAAFPHVRYVQLFGLPVALASKEPLGLDMEAARARLEAPAVGAYLGVRMLRYVRGFLETAVLVPPEPSPGTLNTDLFPRDELRSD